MSATIMPDRAVPTGPEGCSSSSGAGEVSMDCSTPSKRATRSRSASKLAGAGPPRGSRRGAAPRAARSARFHRRGSSGSARGPGRWRFRPRPARFAPPPAVPRPGARSAWDPPAPVAGAARAQRSGRRRAGIMGAAGSCRSSRAAVRSPISSSSVGARSASRPSRRSRPGGAPTPQHRHRIRRVRRVRPAGHRVDHGFAIAVIGGHDHRAAGLLQRLEHAAQDPYPPPRRP